ncbi:protocadherin delta 1 [Paragonimus westermani]|uniref:Protocadherin delta 1 n=1 Tax=Paragonimus westermani TaxID=34504 RepID=A0A5J4NC38_9TREM|nr:protocadherin delta 1 [Paragonimus westermani]
MHGCVVALLLIDLRCIHTIHSVHYRIPEEQSEGTVIGILVAKLPPAIRESLPDLRFRSLHDEEIVFFSLNATSSELSIRQRIDREAVCPNLLTPDNDASFNTMKRIVDNDICELSIRVNILRLNNSSVDIVSMIRVYVEVDDIDDNRCTFLPKERQDIYIRENVNFTKVTLNKPVDLDTNRSNNLIKTKFRLIPMETTTDAPLSTISQRTKYTEIWNNTFQLHIIDTISQVTPFNLELWVNKPLDYEIRQEYAMRLFAGGQKPNRTCTLFIMVHVEDENDHRPTFEQKSIHLTLMENASTLHPIYVPRAHDGDLGSVHKTMIFELSSLSANSIRATFYVVPTNGSVYLRHPLRHSQQSQYKLTLVVRNPEPLIIPKSNNLYLDGGTRLTEATDLFDTMDVLIDVIDVNDNSPAIEIYSINGSTILTLTEHLDMPVTDFAVVSVTDDDSQNNGQVTCILDDKSMQSFRLTRIGPKRADENENDQTEVNGALYKLSAVHAFDRESTSTVDFAIICHDHGHPSRWTNSTATVVILDVNDHAPQFSTSHLHVQVIEDSDPSRKVNDYFVLQVNATDLDIGNNSRIRYLLKQDILKDLFLLESDTGILRSKGKLDREQNSTVRVEVMAVDNGQPEQSNCVQIDVQILDYNDEAPEFLQAIYEFHVQENVVQGYHIGTVVACDRDLGQNAILNFYLKDAASDTNVSADNRLKNHLLPFRIMSHYVPESQCYAVRLFTSGPIDRESLLPDNYRNLDNPNWILQTHLPQTSSIMTTPKYELELIAEDKGLPRQTNTVKIITYVTDVNDEKPKFLLPRVEHRSTVLSRYEPRRFEILKVFAIDGDEGQNGTVQYYLESLDAYDLANKADELRRCKTEGLRQRPVTKQLRINLREYFEMNSTTGLLILSNELPDRLVGLTLQLNVLAKDIGMVVSLESLIHICITITDSPPQHANGTMVGRLRYANQQRTMFYVYIFTAVLVFGLLIAAVFVLFGYFCWHHPKSRRNRQVIKIIRYNEAEGNLVTSEVDRTHTTRKTRDEDSVATVPFVYNWPLEETAGTQPVNFHPSFRYNSTNPLDSHPADGSRLSVGHGHTDIQSLLPTADRVGYLCSPFEHMPNQSMYYTLANAHAVNYSSDTPYVGYCEAT